ncbi:MAG: flavoprotein [Chitinophagaceae bacterium]
MHKIVLAITGASGSVYAKLLLDKLLTIKDQWSELSVVMTENAKLVWKTELDNDGLSIIIMQNFILNRIF